VLQQLLEDPLALLVLSVYALNIFFRPLDRSPHSMPTGFQTAFPKFYARLTERDGAEIEHVAGVPLPESYKRLLRCARGFWLLGGSIRFDTQHAFFHHFEPLDKLTPQQRQMVVRKGGTWPPASHGMLCFAEFFMEADGDQVLWDVSGGLRGGEYPIYYYAHGSRTPSVRKLADSFETRLREFLSYSEFADVDED
jgi:SMI1 / KNR4 family (SUKH-1)